MKLFLLWGLLIRVTVGLAQYEPVSPGEVVSHTYFTLSFHSVHKQAEWVYYRLTPADSLIVAGRSKGFREDKQVRRGSALPADYTHSGYDRGHLCPAADMAFSEQAMYETFYMSNISPQHPQFNRGIWKKLEKKVRDWSRGDTLYVVTGPLFRDVQGVIGKSRVTVPGYFYKIVYFPRLQRMIAFILPNEGSDRELSSYVVAVDRVEEETGIDFFPQLPDTLENSLEASSDYHCLPGFP